MGELFEKTSPKAPLSWTGERLTDGAGRQVEIEHLHRYLLARSICRGLDVLDVASGEGYGSSFLAQTANTVVGVEIDRVSLEHAQASYIANNLTFMWGDARRLPLANDSVDVVVSFETIEHFYEHNQFLAEVRRVLRPGGRLLISSPDRDVYSPAGAPPNPYHVHELSKSEFTALLKSHFKNFALLGQRPILGSALVVEDVFGLDTEVSTVTFERRGDDKFEASKGLPRAVYLLAVASDDPCAGIPNSLYIDNHTVEPETTDLARAAELARVSAALTEAATYSRHVEAEIRRRDEEIAKLKVVSEQAATSCQLVKEELDRRAETVLDLQAALEQSAKSSQLIQEELHRRNDEIKAAREHSSAASGQIEDLQQSLAVKTKILTAGLVARDRAISQSSRVVKQVRAELLAAMQKGEEFAAYSQTLEERLRHVQAQLENKSNQVHELQADRKRESRRAQDLQMTCDSLQMALDTKSGELRTILGSSSWRITKPLRSIFGSHPLLRQGSRRFAKLLWWTITLQLPTRLSQYRRARYSLTAPNGRDASSHVSPPNSAVLGPDADQLAVPAEDPSKADYTGYRPAPLDLRANFNRQARSELREFLDSNQTLSFPTFEAPDITVVIVVWNQAHLTLRCLRALHAQVGPSTEIVLVDNFSTDETPSLLARLDGVNVISNRTNEGFLLGCNRGAAAARGQSLLLLNSDAFVREGAFSAALNTLGSNEDIGAVGGKLVLPTGVLQEAGSIIWSDASTIAYGRGLDPDAGEVMFRRDIDYCSGAFLLTPRKLWEQLGGLDTSYLPAYYEETDYCMRLRQAGFRVVYEPRAVIDHFEFGSEEKSGDAVKSSLVNRKRFRARHAASLKTHYFPNVKENILAARERLRPGQKRLLVIDNEVPLVSLGSGYPRAAAILREAAADWAVTFFPLHQLKVDWDLARADVPDEVEIISDMAFTRFVDFIEARKGFYDVIFVSRPDNMKVIRDVFRDRPHLLHGVRLVYDAEALFSARDIARSRLEGKDLSVDEIEQSSRLRWRWQQMPMW